MIFHSTTYCQKSSRLAGSGRRGACRIIQYQDQGAPRRQGSSARQAGGGGDLHEPRRRQEADAVRAQAGSQGRGGAQGPRLRRRLPEGQQGRHGGWHGQKRPCSRPLVWPPLLEQCLHCLRAALWARVGSHPARTTTKRLRQRWLPRGEPSRFCLSGTHPGGLRARGQVGL